MKWTWDEPTVPGWYFVRDFEWITDKSYSLQARVVWIGRNMIEDNLIKRECAWAGPIPEPVEAEPLDDDVERD